MSREIFGKSSESALTGLLTHYTSSRASALTYRDQPRRAFTRSRVRRVLDVIRYCICSGAEASVGQGYEHDIRTARPHFTKGVHNLRVPGSNPSVSLRFRDLYGPVIALPCALRCCTAVRELLATSARAII